MARQLSTFPVHLGLGASAVAEPEFTGPEFYQGYTSRHQADGAEARLVSMFTFSRSWDTWEVHPHGSEVVVCVKGRLTLIQEIEGGEHVKTELLPGQYAINEPGVWHTADVDDEVQAMFITAGIGTQVRKRR